MASAGLELQKAIFQRLRNDAPLVTVLGGGKIYDDPPQRTEFPYVTFGRSTIRDWATGTESGHEHLVTLHVWSRAAGRRQVHDVMAMIEGLLHDQTLALTGFRLVNLRHENSDARREPDGATYHGTIRYRAVTEPDV